MIDRPHLLPANLPQLMLIRAPAGYGKTVAATQWAQRQPLDTHVLWVRGAAIRPSRFWHAMFESLSGYLETESLLPLSLSHTLTGAESEATAEVQTKQLASLIDANVVLVIDNFEALTTPELDTRLVGMIEQSPGLKVMAISRRFSLLDGPLTKARLPTELITAGDLAFRQQEARALAQFYGPLGDEAVEALLEATAGWPLAVQAALSGRGLRIPQLVAGRMNLAYLPAQLSLIANDYLKLIDSENQRRALLAVAVCQGLSAKTFAETMIARSAEEDASSLYARTLKIFRELSDLGLITREWSPQANRYKCHEGLVSELRRRAHQELTKFELDRLVREHAVDLSVDDPFSAIMLYCEVGDFASADRLILGRPAEVAGVDHGLGEMMRSIPSEKLAGYPALACVRLVTGVFDRFTSDEWVRAGLEDLRNDVRSMFAEGLPQSEVSAASILLLVERMLGNQGLGPKPQTSSYAVQDCVGVDQPSAAVCEIDVDARAGYFRVAELVWGEYELTETKAPAGYYPRSEPLPFTLDAEHLSIDLAGVVNDQITTPDLPLTGGLGRDFFALLGGGVLVFGLAAVAVLQLRTRRREVS